jgi:hypothetical protein
MSENPNSCTVEFEFGFSSEHSLISIFDPHFIGTNPLRLVSSKSLVSLVSEVKSTRAI